MADVVIQAQSTLFNRQGHTMQTKYYNGSPLLAAIIGNAVLNSQTNGSLTTDEQAKLAAILQQDQNIIGGGTTLYNIQALNPLLFTGAAELQAIYELDPFSTDYETDTLDLFTRSYGVARAAAMSGPVNVRGGTARQAFELAELDNLMSIQRFREIWQNQLAVAGLVIQATQVANAAEAEIRNEQLKAQQQQAATEQGRTVQILGAAEQLVKDRELNIRACALAGEFLTSPQMFTEEVLEGQGFQGGVTTGFGMSTWR